MAQEPVELIVLHQWASYMTIPIGVFDPEGNLVYYNEPAERVVGRRFDEAGEINARELASLGSPTDLEGRAVPNEALPTPIALSQNRPAHQRLRIRGLDGAWRQIDSLAFPLVGSGGRLLGALTVWMSPP